MKESEVVKICDNIERILKEMKEGTPTKTKGFVIAKTNKLLRLIIRKYWRVKEESEGRFSNDLKRLWWNIIDMERLLRSPRILGKEYNLQYIEARGVCIDMVCRNFEKAYATFLYARELIYTTMKELDRIERYATMESR